MTLGYIISLGGVEMDLSKVKSVTDWPLSTTVTGNCIHVPSVNES